MKQPLLALLFIGAGCALAHGQSLAPQNPNPAAIIEDATADQVVASQAILLLKRLDDAVIVYRSVTEFEQSRRLARISFEDFQIDLSEVTPAVKDLISRLPDGRVKTELSQALVAYCDGGYWWERVQRPQVITILALRSSETDATSDFLLRANLLYTVAIHWQEAHDHLQNAIKHFK